MTFQRWKIGKSNILDLDLSLGYISGERIRDYPCLNTCVDRLVSNGLSIKYISGGGGMPFLDFRFLFI